MSLYARAHIGISVAVAQPTGDYGAVIVSGANLLLEASTIEVSHPLLKGDVLVVNAIEAEMLGALQVDTLVTASQAAASLLGMASVVIVTAGPAGVAVVTRSGLKAEIAGHQVSIVSTHGAGDCFIGSPATRLAEGMEIEESVRYANAAAALRVASPGHFDHAREKKSILALSRASKSGPPGRLLINDPLSGL